MTMEDFAVDIRNAVIPVSVRWKANGRFHRVTRAPGDDLSDLPQGIRQAIEAHWTPERIAEWGSLQEPPAQPTVIDYSIAVSAHLDAKARERSYDSALSIATYSDSTVAAWKDEANAFVAWRDQVWTYAQSELAKVQNGERSIPTIEDFIAELPLFGWPNAA